MYTLSSTTRLNNKKHHEDCVSTVNGELQIDTSVKHCYCRVLFADALLEVELLDATVVRLKASCTNI